jgi:hypothetical protein
MTKRKRCGKTERHTPHWWPLDTPTSEEQWWCDGKEPNPNRIDIETD